jgi:hypothetical protein
MAMAAVAAATTTAAVTTMMAIVTGVEKYRRPLATSHDWHEPDRALSIFRPYRDDRAQLILLRINQAELSRSVATESIT